MRTFFIVASIAVLFLSACSSKKADIDHVQQAREYQSKGELRAALIELKNVLQQQPENKNARLVLADVYLEIGNGITAEKELRRAIELGVPAADVAVSLARSLLLQRQYRKVLDEIAVMQTGGGTNNTELLAIKAEAQLGLNDLQGAEDTLSNAARIKENALFVLLARARLAFMKKDTAAFEKYIAQALQTAPASVDTWLLKGDEAFAHSQYAEAQNAYQRVLEYSNLKIITVRSSKARVGLVFALLAQDKENDALPHIDVLLKSNPRHSLPNYLRGLSAFKKADFKTAVDYLQRSVNDAPVSSPSIALLGAVNYALGSYQQAELYLGKYVAAVPDDMHARKLLSATRLKLGQPEKILETLGPQLTLNSEDIQMLTMAGTAATMMGDYREGRRYLKKAVEVAPQDSTVRTRLAEAYLAEGEYDEAIKELEKSADLGGKDIRPHMTKVMAYVRKGDVDRALNAAQELIRKHPNNPLLLNLLGGVHLVRQERDQARKYFQQALQQQPGIVIAQLNLAYLDYQEKNYEAAREGYQRILTQDHANVSAMTALAQIAEIKNQQSEALDWLEKGRQANRTALQPRLLLARYYMKKGDAKKAAEYAQEAVDANPAHPAALSMQGDVQFAARQFSEAAKTFNRVTKVLPQSPLGYVRAGQAHMQLREMDHARRWFNQALKINRDFFPATSSLALLELQAGNANGAQQIVADYIKRHGKSPEGYNLQGDVSMVQGKFHEAERAYNAAAQYQNSGLLAIKRYRASNKVGNESQALNPLKEWLAQHPKDDQVLLVLADAYRNAKRGKESVDIYKDILTRMPNHLAVLNNLALAYATLNDPRSLETAEHAFKLSNSHPLVADTLGWILIQRGDFKRGSEILQRVAEQLPAHPDIQYHWAIALEKSGDLDRARQVLKRALETKKPFDSRAAAETVYQRMK